MNRVTMNILGYFFLLTIYLGVLLFSFGGCSQIVFKVFEVVVETEKLLLKFIWKYKRPKIFKTILGKAGGLTLQHIIKLQELRQGGLGANRPVAWKREFRYRCKHKCYLIYDTGNIAM